MKKSPRISYIRRSNIINYINLGLIEISSSYRDCKDNHKKEVSKYANQIFSNDYSAVNSQPIQWYPGHIAKAEKQLQEQLAKVDLIIEVRDARIPISTSHPYLEKWIKNKKHLLVLNRKDMISRQALHEWDYWFKRQDKLIWWCNAKTGDGVKQIKETAISLGEDLNQRRQSRGMLERPVRALTLGFPNVGKSALINRLVKKKVVLSARRAGVTKSLRWVRVGEMLDLLDAPGVLPPRLEDQESAIKLAICDDIGEAAYDIESIAINLIKLLQRLENIKNAGASLKTLTKRYKVPLQLEQENVYEWLESAASIHTSANTRRMSQRILDDFRKNLLGQISLELP